MFKRNKSEARSGIKEGLVSFILLERGDIPDAQISLTWVEVAPGACQNPHCHVPAQSYIIVRGEGRMLVGDDERDVREGDAVYIPPNVVHGIRNEGRETLVYVTASTPAMNVTSLYTDYGSEAPK